jgi:hypothetical protein
MQPRKVMLTSLVAFGLAPILHAETTEYLLLPVRADLGQNTHAVVIEPLQLVSFKVDDCGITSPVGESSELVNFSPSKNHAGTAYIGEIKIEDSGQESSGYVMGHVMNVGTQLSNFTILEDGQTCSEMVNGKFLVFKKYSAAGR